MPIGLLDYGAGNLGSVCNALTRLGEEFRFIEKASDFDTFEKIIFPGDGHFGTTMAALEKLNYKESLIKRLNDNKSFLGICIGLQVLFEASEEAPDVAGLGFIKGKVKKFDAPKVPLIGWNKTGDDFFYYIHSYYVEPVDKSIVALQANYGLDYCAAVQQGNICAVQFHPEKSGLKGLSLLDKWLKTGNISGGKQ
ncbi:MAG: imidazole glycerol phosphate synthase subunit HisH [Spirochaetaceae bacterium]|jgi:imidazole glycerol phosphate synthase glutamine amidotransferase subunit|nr:imidazole glycerol phosphate synthase subunit HisH [Spirochaetaceae bacterium]